LDSKLSRSNILKKVKWYDFAKNALPASTIANYWFCPAKIYNMKEQGSVETPCTKMGTQIHEEETLDILEKLGPLKKVKIESVFDAMTHSRLNLKVALREKQVIANSENSILFRCIVPEKRYIGVPDVADCSNGKQPTLMEIKTTGRLPYDVWMDNKIQMGVYLLGLERMSFKPEFGRIEYRVRDKQSVRRSFQVYLDGELRQEVEETSQAVSDILSGKEPVPANNPRKCASCGYRQSCQWVLE